MAEHPSPSFLGACGAGSPLQLTVQRGGDPALGHVLHQPFVLLGEDAHPVSPGGGGLSPRVYLQLVGGRVFCLSLGEGGIPPGDGAMLRCGWLGPGQTLRVGGAAVQLTRTDAEESPPPVWAAGDWNPLTSSS